MKCRTLQVALSTAAAFVFVVAGAQRLFATGVPIAGFLPLLGISLTDKFKDENDDTFLFVDPEFTYDGSPLGPGSSAHYDLALLDTGAAVNILTPSAHSSFQIVSEGFSGTNSITLTGATGFVNGLISDPLAQFAVGLAPNNIAGTAPFSLHTTNMKGVSSISVVSLLPGSDLPNIVGLPFATQHATYIRNDQPQIVAINGTTVRTPQIEFLPLGSGAQGTMSRAPLIFTPGAAFSLPPFYFPDILNPFEPFTENPSQPTVVSGGMFLNVSVQHTTELLGTQNLGSQFLFDTGADVTVMSEFNASLLGFDVLLHEPEFTVTVVGSGGVKEDVPGFFADQLTLPAVGGNLVAQNVPIVVLDVPDVSDPVNVIPGIIGTNVFAGRNLVIDPVTAIGGGSPSLHFSAPTTTQRNWSTAAASATFSTNGNWSGSVAPDIRGVANVRHVSGGNQTAVVATNATVWELNVSGSASQTMTVQINSGAKLTTFSGVNIEPNGVVALLNGAIDAQFVEVVGGTLRGSGSITTGSGPIPGQVENRLGTVAPGNGIGTLEIRGRYANGVDGTLAIELGGFTPGVSHDLLVIDGGVALDGTLAIVLAGGFTPSIGDTFAIITASDDISGTFDNATFSGTYNWKITTDTCGGTNCVLLSVGIPGDFNDDDVVDAADYTVWRNAYDGEFDWAADGNNDLTIDEADYAIWRSHYGDTAPLGSGGGGLAGVPEPTSALLLLIAALGGALVPRRRTLAMGGMLSRRSRASMWR